MAIEQNRNQTQGQKTGSNVEQGGLGERNANQQKGQFENREAGQKQQGSQQGQNIKSEKGDL